MCLTVYVLGDNKFEILKEQLKRHAIYNWIAFSSIDASSDAPTVKLTVLCSR